VLGSGFGHLACKATDAESSDGTDWSHTTEPSKEDVVGRVQNDMKSFGLMQES